MARNVSIIQYPLTTFKQNGEIHKARQKKRGQKQTRRDAALNMLPETAACTRRPVASTF